MDGRLLRVATGGEDAEWATFLSLLPDTADNEGKHLALNDDGTALEWVDPPEPASTDTAIELVSEAVALTLTQAHRNKIIEAPAALVITLPAEGTEAIEIGSLYTISNVGEGVVTITAASGVYLNSDLAGSVTLPDQWAGVTLYKRATNAWVVQGAFTSGT
jgi:hypothetical protein